MKRMLKGFLSIAALVSCATASAVDFLPRSYSADTSRWLVGWSQEVNKYDMEKIYGTFSAQLGGGRSFRSDNIARCLFGKDVSCGDCPTLTISGSRVASRGANDWLADYFGLPTDFQSTVKFDPKISHFIADFGFFLGLDEWANGLWVRVHAPVVWAKWDLNMCEEVCVTGTQNHVKGYFEPFGVDRNDLLKGFTDYMNGSVPKLHASNTIKQNPLCSCRIQPCDDTETKLADLRVILGWNFLRDEDYHMGLGLLYAAPTGNAPDASRVFSPVIGNGNHHELGGFFTSHYTFWRSEDEESSFGLYVDAHVTHLFDDCQTRCFDLCKAGKNSKYMLATKLGTTRNDPQLSNTVTNATNADHKADAGVEFQYEFTPVANLTTRRVDVGYSVQGDITAMFNYTRGGFGWDLGYNFWARSCEDVDCKKDCKDECDPCGVKTSSTIAANTWVLKGDSHVVGFESENPDCHVRLAPSQSCADIHKGTNKFNGLSGNLDTTTLTLGGNTIAFLPTQNPGVDNPKVSVAQSTTATKNNEFVLDKMTTSTFILSSNPVVFLSDADVNLNSSRSKGRSHKVFTHLSYTWVDKEDWIPYLGVGASVEIGSDRCDDCDDTCPTTCPTTSCGPCPTKTSCSPCPTTCDTKCDDCPNCSLSQWEVWVKGGVSFN